MSVPNVGDERIKVVCYWSTLFRLAREASTGDPVAVAKHQEYETLCLRADEVRL